MTEICNFVSIFLALIKYICLNHILQFTGKKIFLPLRSILLYPLTLHCFLVYFKGNFSHVLLFNKLQYFVFLSQWDRHNITEILLKVELNTVNQWASLFSIFISSAEKKKILIIAVPTIGGSLLIASLLVLFGYYWRQRAKSQEKTAILTARMTGYEDEVSHSHVNV